LPQPKLSLQKANGGYVIHKNLLYQKSAKGTEAIATRQHGLGPKLRSLLIMIDGKKTFDDLVKVSHSPGDAEQALDQLLQDGFIEPSAAAPRPAQTVFTASAPAPLTAESQTSLAEAQRYAVRRLTDIMGPNAEDLCLRIEATRTANEFESVVTKAEGLLRQFVNSTTASEFAAQMQAHMPAR
jgi:hypothetical protein